MAKKRSTATRRQESQAAAARAAAIRKEADRKERRRRSLVVTGVGIAVLAVILVITTLYRSSQDTSGQATGSPSHVAGYAIPVGSSSAKTNVTIYEDFMCPFCGQLESATRAKLQAGLDSGNVRVRYHVLDFLDRSSSTEYSLRSANAMAVVLNASGPTVAKKFHDLLYQHQPQEGSAGISDGRLVDYAVQAGATRSAVAKGISDRTYQQWVKNGTDRASKDGVTGTPTVLINGKAVSGSVAQIAQRIEQAVAAAR